MFIAYIVVAVLGAAAMTNSAVWKLRRDPRTIAIIHEQCGVPLSWFPYLAACELAAAAGLLVGIAWAPAGIAAAIGLILYMIGAMIAHLRVGDTRGLTTPLIPMIIGIAALVTRIASL